MSKVAFILVCSLVGSVVRAQSDRSEILLVNIESLSRRDIGRIIEEIHSLHPKVIGIDLQFSSVKGRDDDEKLMEALWNCEDLVMPTVINNYSNGVDKNYLQFRLGSLPQFIPVRSHTGFVNTVLEDDEFETLQKFSTYEHVAGKVEYHFGISVAMRVDSATAVNFVNRNPKLVTINYSKYRGNFKCVSYQKVFDGSLKKKDVFGKIVLIGWLGPGDEDKFYSPIASKKNAQKPDVYGLEYLAIIIQQVLND